VDLDWRDTSGRGTNVVVEEEPRGPGSLVAITWWSGDHQCWGWLVERRNKTGRTVLIRGYALSREWAQRRAEAAWRNCSRWRMEPGWLHRKGVK